MSLNIVVAINGDGIIGVRDYGEYCIPWPYLLEDRRFFNNITSSKKSIPNAIIMGYNTWSTMPKKYFDNDKRSNIVINRNYRDSVDTKNTIFMESLDRSIHHARELLYSGLVDKIMIIGGGQIYYDVIKNYEVDKMYITMLNNFDYPDIIDGVVQIKFPFCKKSLEFLVKDNYLDDKILSSHKNNSICYDVHEFAVVKSIRCQADLSCFFIQSKKINGNLLHGNWITCGQINYLP